VREIWELYPSAGDLEYATDCLLYGWADVCKLFSIALA